MCEKCKKSPKTVTEPVPVIAGFTSRIETLKQLKTILMCDQFIITGSTAMQIYGLVDEPSDVDIVLVNPTEETKGTLERLQRDNPARVKPSSPRVAAIFMYNGYKIDVFFDGTEVKNLPEIEGIAVNRIDRIIRKKKESGRLKDWAQLQKISLQFFEKSKFKEVIKTTTYKGLR